MKGEKVKKLNKGVFRLFVCRNPLIREMGKVTFRESRKNERKHNVGRKRRRQGEGL